MLEHLDVTWEEKSSKLLWGLVSKEDSKKVPLPVSFSQPLRLAIVRLGQLARTPMSPVEESSRIIPEDWSSKKVRRKFSYQ